MPGLRPLIARRHFLASTFIGSVGFFIPLTGAQAASTPPPSPSPGAQTLSEAAPAVSISQSSVIGAATAEQSGDTSIRPFKFRASDQVLADLKRRVAARARDRSHTGR